MSNKPRARERFCCFHHSIAVLMSATLFFVSQGRAHAQSEPPPPPAVGSPVQRLIDDGVAFRKKGDDQAALDSFLKAYELSKDARALAQIALAEQALGRWVDAEAHLAKALDSKEDPWIARNRGPLEGALAEIQHHTGSLELSGGLPGAEIRLNGARVGIFPLKGPLRTVAGSAALEVRADGYLPVIRTVSVPVGGLARESVTLISVQPVSPASVRQPDRAPEPSRWTSRKKIALGLGVGAIAAAASGTLFYFVYRGKSNDFQNSTDHEGARCTTAELTDNCKGLYDDIHQAQILSAIGFAGAGALLGAATYLVMTNQAADHGGVAVDHRTLSFRCVPTAGAALTCLGSF